MRHFFFIFAANDRPVIIPLREDQIDVDYYASQIKPVLRGLEIGEYWIDEIDNHHFVVIRVQ